MMQLFDKAQGAVLAALLLGAALVALVAVLATSACRSRRSPPANVSPPVPAARASGSAASIPVPAPGEALRLQISATVEQASLLVHVEATNRLSEPVYLKNWLHDWYGILGVSARDLLQMGRSPFTRELAYVSLGQAGEVVLLNGDGPGPPPGISPVVPRLPEGTRLLSGETYRGTIRLPLPLREWHAYDSPKEGTEPVLVSSVRYRLESLRESVCSHRPVEEHVNFPGVFKARGYPPDVAEATAQLPQPVTLLRRTDAFERF